MTATTTPQTWQLAYRAWAHPTPTTVEPEVEDDVIDESLPVFEIHYRGRVFGRSNVHAKTFKLYRAMFNGRPLAEPPTLVVVGDRRTSERG